MPSSAFGQDVTETADTTTDTSGPIAMEATASTEPSVSEDVTPASDVVKVPETAEEAAKDVSLLVKAIQSKAVAPAIGFGLMLLVFVLNKLGLKDKVGDKAVPWITMAIGVAGAVGVGLVADIGIVSAIIQGVLVGFSAIGSWETVFKHALAKS